VFVVNDLATRLQSALVNAYRLERELAVGASGDGLPYYTAWVHAAQERRAEACAILTELEAPNELHGTPLGGTERQTQIPLIPLSRCARTQQQQTASQGVSRGQSTWKRSSAVAAKGFQVL